MCLSFSQWMIWVSQSLFEICVSLNGRVARLCNLCLRVDWSKMWGMGQTDRIYCAFFPLFFSPPLFPSWSRIAVGQSTCWNVTFVSVLCCGAVPLTLFLLSLKVELRWADGRVSLKMPAMVCAFLNKAWVIFCKVIEERCCCNCFLVMQSDIITSSTVNDRKHW